MKKLSKAELKSIKKQLEEELGSLKETDNMHGGIKDLAIDKYSDPVDRASMESGRDLGLRMRERSNKLIPKIKNIIERIDNGSYQTCVNCGKLISTQRLLARPITDLCIDCKELEEQGERFD